MSRPLGPSDRVVDHTTRFAAFLSDEVAPIEEALSHRNVGTPWQPVLDDAGRMHAEVWEARREVQRRSAAAGLLNPHISAAAGGGGFSRVEMQHVEEFVYRNSGLGLGLAALAWTENASPAIEKTSSPVSAYSCAGLILVDFSM